VYSRMSGDNQSVASDASSLSSAQTKVECPHCNKDFQFRSVFNHLYSKHNTEFFNSLNRDWLLKSKEDSPLLVWWTYKDDFDEEKTVNLFGCLATKKTFMTEERALQYFKKSPDVLKLHNKELAKLKKKARSNTTTVKSISSKTPFQEAMDRQDPDLARALYSRYLYRLERCRMAIEVMSTDYTNESKFRTGAGELTVSFRTLKENMTHIESELEKFIKNKDLDPKHLYSLFYKVEEIIFVGMYHTNLSHHYKYVSTEGDGNMLGPTDKFNVGNPAYPQVDF
jgi:hypothetical protein